MASLDRSLIAGLSLFEGIAAADLDRIVGQARSIRIAKDQPVFEQEQEAHSFFLLLDGHVRVVKSTPDGHEVTVR
ncbi:MAG: cyclic nucleotide-binding domain-containing protein, partial [Mesorhizobium sp.]